MKRAAVWAMLGTDLAGLLCLLVVLALARGHMGSTASAVTLCFMAASFATVGCLLALRRPGNAEGWLLLAVGTAWIMPMASAAVGQALLDRQVGGSMAAWLAWPAVWLWLPPLGLMGTQVLLRFPDGALPTPRWRWFSRLTLVLVAAATVGMATAAPADTDGYANLTYLPWVPQGLTTGVGLAALACFPVSVASMVVRYRRAGIAQREQIRWVAWAAGIFVGVYLLGFIRFLPQAFSDSEAMTAATFLAYSLVPVAIGFAISRYRLYDIDRIMSRTVAYAATTALLAAVYLGGVALATNVLPFSGEVGTAASVLVAVALFAPLRRRIQRVVDRRFNRARYDADAIVAVFAQRLRERVDLEAMRGDLAAVVGKTVGPAHASLWLRSEPGPHGPGSPPGQNSRRAPSSAPRIAS